MKSYNSLQQSQANGRRHHTGAGLADLIRAALKTGPLSVKQIARRVGRTESAVRDALRTLMYVTGGVYGVGSKHARCYQLNDPSVTNYDRPHVAGRITVGRGSRWGAGLV